MKKNDDKTVLPQQKIRLLTMTAILIALITVTTTYLQIKVPIAGGYVHVGDSLIYLAATLLPAPYAMAAGAIGAGVADLLTAPAWVLPTFFIKMAITLPFTSKKATIITKRNVIATLFAYLISGTGYYFATVYMLGAEIDYVVSMMASFAQSCSSAIVFVVLGIALDKIQFKRKFCYKGE